MMMFPAAMARMPTVFAPQVFRGVDNMDLAARVAARMVEWKPDAVFIDSGAGAGVIDRLRQLGHEVIEVNFGGKPVTDVRFANRRAEMWMTLADQVRAGLAIPNDVALKVELATPTYSYDAQQRIIIESKDDIRKRLGASTNRADAVIMAWVDRMWSVMRVESKKRGETSAAPVEDPLAEF